MFAHRVVILIALLSVAAGNDRQIPELCVEERLFSKRLTFTGELQAAHSVMVSVPRVSGQWSYLLSYLIPEGSHVQAGEVVARFDTSDLELKKLDLAKTMEEARIKIAQREAELEIQRQDLRLAWANARKNLKVAEIYAEIDPSLIPRADAEKYQYDQSKTRIEFQVSEEKLQSLETSAQADLKVLQLDYEQAALELERLLSEHQSMTLRAPVAGLVIYQENWQANRKVQTGDSLYRGQFLLEIANLEKMQVLASVYSADFPYLRPQMPTEIILDALPGDSYAGSVAHIPEAAKPLRFQSQLNVFRAVIDLQSTSPVMKPGMTARVWVQTEGVPALALPRRSIRLDEAARPYVVRREAPEVPVPIRILDADADWAQVEAELRPGDFLLPAAAGLQADGNAGFDWIPIRRENLVFSVSGTGTLEAALSIDIGPPVLSDYSRLKIVRMAPEGIQVRQGDFLLLFDPSEIQKRLREEQANLQKSSEELEKTRSTLSTQIKDLEVELEDARVQSRKSDNKLLQAREFDSLIEVRKAEFEAELARDRVGMLERKLEFLKKQVALQLDVLLDSENFYRRRVESNRQGVDRLTVEAPIDGTVVYVPNWNNEKKKVGDEVYVMDRILSIPDLTSIRLRGQVAEVDAGKIRLGQPVLVTLDSIPDKNFRGEVVQMGTVFKQASYERPIKVLEIVVRLETVDPARMRPEMMGRLQIVLEEFKDALAVPLSVIRMEDGQAYVWVKNGEQAVRRAVRVGRDNGIVAVIEEGLGDGESVASRPPS